MKLILGLDPGSINTGFGIVRAGLGRIEHVEHGVFSCRPQLAFATRLRDISLQLQQLFVRVKPDITVVERIFLGKNADSAFKLGHIRGVCLALAAQADCEIIEYATRSVKKGITGSGAASKEQVQMLLYASLGLRAEQGIRPALRIDASDALALAFYHARELEVSEAFTKQKARGEKGLNP